MKKLYSVSTMCGCNPSKLLSTGKDEFESENYEEAIAAYDAEVAYLEDRYTRIDHLDYNPTDEEINARAFMTMLTCIEDEDSPEILEISDRYFKK